MFNYGKYRKEKKIIRDLIFKYYHEGHAKCNGELYRPFLHDEWKLFILPDDTKISIINKEDYIKAYSPVDYDASLLWKTKIYYMDVYDKMASVKLKISNQKFGYMDYFNLMKVNGNWQIVHKISQMIN